MPGFDGTGPMGTGPFGRGLGPCGGGQAWGRGRGFRRGGWFGSGGVSAPVSPADEKGLLSNQKNWLESQLSAINDRLQNLDKD